MSWQTLACAVATIFAIGIIISIFFDRH